MFIHNFLLFSLFISLCFHPPIGRSVCKASLCLLCLICHIKSLLAVGFHISAGTGIGARSQQKYVSSTSSNI